MTHFNLPMIVVNALAAVAISVLAREFVPPAWLLRKPMSCHLCMSWRGVSGVVLMQGIVALGWNGFVQHDAALFSVLMLVVVWPSTWALAWLFKQEEPNSIGVTKSAVLAWAALAVGLYSVPFVELSLSSLASVALSILVLKTIAFFTPVAPELP